MLDYIRNNDEAVLKGGDKVRKGHVDSFHFVVLQADSLMYFILQILSFYQTDLLPSESLMELFDVAGMCRAVVLKLVRNILKTCNGLQRGFLMHHPMNRRKLVQCNKPVA